MVGFLDVEFGLMLLEDLVAAFDDLSLVVAGDDFGDGDGVASGVVLQGDPGSLEPGEFGVFDFVVGAGSGGAGEDEGERKRYGEFDGGASCS